MRPIAVPTVKCRSLIRAAPRTRLTIVKGATGRRRMAADSQHTAAGEPAGRAAQGEASTASAVRHGLLARPMRKATTALTRAAGEGGEKPGHWAKEERCLEDEKVKRDHNEAPEDDTRRPQ